MKKTLFMFVLAFLFVATTSKRLLIKDKIITPIKEILIKPVKEVVVNPLKECLIEKQLNDTEKIVKEKMGAKDFLRKFKKTGVVKGKDPGCYAIYESETRLKTPKLCLHNRKKSSKKGEKEEINKDVVEEALEELSDEILEELEEIIEIIEIIEEIIEVIEVIIEYREIRPKNAREEVIGNNLAGYTKDEYKYIMEECEIILEEDDFWYYWYSPVKDIVEDIKEGLKEVEERR